MKISLIISYYKRLDFLELILMSLLYQEYKNFEVVIAEDDNASETKDFLYGIARKFPLRLLHVYQKKDEGFRKNEMLNKAIWIASGELIIIIDGDCILHRAFFKEYIKTIKPKSVLFGRRALLSERITAKLLFSKNLSLLSLFNLIASGSKRVEDVLYLPNIPGFLRKQRNKGVQGSNMGFLKTDILAINGFDEDYQKATAGEDDDIEWRFRALGYQFVPMKNKALQYHLHHKFNYSNEESVHNRAIMDKKRTEGIIFCLNGISKYAQEPITELVEY
ncbi:MAG: glycosyltransferase [Bacteroidetes bacterium]|nr:glycosyltransferase [Bacteroidota bacterium]